MLCKIVLVLCIVCLLGSLKATETRKKLVIDHDGGGDDAFAITLSLLYEKYFNGPKVVALTTTFGNVNLTQVNINSNRILSLCDRRDIPQYSGAHKALISNVVSDYYYGLDGLGDDGYIPPETIDIKCQHAAIALIELSKKYEGELIIIAIGPVTNIALALRMDPKFIDRLAQLYIGAGHIYGENFTNPEFNANMDPEAYHIVVDSAKIEKVTFLPFSQVFTTLTITKDWRANVLGKIQTPIIQALNGFEQVSSPKKPAWTDLDPAVAAIALDSNIVQEYRNVRNGIILEGDKRGTNTNDFESTSPNVRIVYKGNVERYKKFLLDVYSAELKEATKSQA